MTLFPGRQRALERTGGAMETAENNIERALSRMRSDLDGNAQPRAYTPGDATDWASPAPTTIQEALDRLAAANPGA